MNLKHFFIKFLKKAGGLKYLNFVYILPINQSFVKIPIIKGLGYPNIFLEPTWLMDIIDKIGESNGSFVYVGVNIGQTLIVLKASKNNVPYIGFEPNTSCLYYLNELITINNYQNCQIFGLALSDKFQTQVLEKNEDTDAAGSVIKKLRPNYFNKEEAILGVNYDSLSIKANVSFIKIDVEGAEIEVLIGMKNMILKDRPIITCEVLDSYSHDALAFTRKRADRVCDFLKEINYSIIQLEQNEGHDKIIALKELESIKIKQWTHESYRLNDYLFVPKEKRIGFLEMFKSN